MKRGLETVGRGLAHFALLLFSGCVVGRPFSGPGLSSSTCDDCSPAVLVVITHAVLDRSTRRPFDRATFEIDDALRRGEFDGLVGTSIRKELFGDEVWTMTAWRDAESARRFSTSPRHREAIAQTGRAIVSMRSHHFEIPAQRLPLPWSEALAELDAHHPPLRSTRSRGRSR